MPLAYVLFITCLGFVPLYTAVRLSLERNNTGMELLYVTTLRPGAIIRGKYLAALALTLLIYSAYAVYRFHLFPARVDLTSVAWVLFLGLVICGLANGLAGFVGAIGGTGSCAAGRACLRGLPGGSDVPDAHRTRRGPTRASPRSWELGAVVGQDAAGLLFNVAVIGLLWSLPRP